MKWVLRIGLGTLAALVLVAVVLVVFVSGADFTGYRTQIASAIEAATGRKVTIRGRIDQRVLTLSPSLVIEDVAFANAPWGRRPQMLTAERVEVTLALMPLLSGDFHVERFRLVGADVLLETNAEGRGNWEFWPKAEREATLAKGDSRTAAALQNLRVEKSLFTFHDGRSRLTSRVRIDEIVARASSLSTPLELTTKGAYNDVPIETSGRLGAFAGFLRGTDAWPVELTVKFGKSDLALDVRADLSGRFPVLEGNVRSTLLDVDEIAAATARASEGETGEEKSKAATRRGAWPEEPLPLGILGMFDADLDVGIGALMAGGSPFRDVAAKVALKGGDLRATELSADLTNGKVNGDLRIDVSTERPLVETNLRATRISLAQVTRDAVGRALISVPAAATVKLTARGRSIRELVGALSGPVSVYVGGGPLHQDLFRLASTDLLSVVGLASRDAFRVVCGVFPLHFDKGVGYGRNLVLDTTRFTLYGRGALNLPRRSVDFILVPAGKGVSLGRIAGLVPIRVRGPMTRPSVAPDPSGVPSEVVKGILGAATLPLDVAGSLFGGDKKRRGCGARDDGPGDLLKKPGELLKKPADALKRLNPFR